MPLAYEMGGIEMTTQVTELIQSTQGQALLAQMYGPQHVEEQGARYEKLDASFREHFGEQEHMHLFSSRAAVRSAVIIRIITMVKCSREALRWIRLPWLYRQATTSLRSTPRDTTKVCHQPCGLET